METAHRYMVKTGVISGLLLLVLASGVSAQNFAGAVSPESFSEAPEEKTTDIFVKEPLEDASPTAEAIKDEAQETIQEEEMAIPADIEQLSHYTVGKTDVIEIQVMRHPEVSGQFVVNNEGNIQYQFVGDIKVDGLTKDAIKDVLVEKLSTYIISPEVTVKIVGYNSKIVYVVGEVGNPGKIYMQGDAITVREALVQAGLPLLSAKTGDGRLITPSADGHPKVQKVNVQKLLYEGDLRENLVMNPGDTLYIPPTFLAKTMRVLQPIAAPIGTAAGTGRTVMTGF